MMNQQMDELTKIKPLQIYFLKDVSAKEKYVFAERFSPNIVVSEEIREKDKFF